MIEIPVKICDNCQRSYPSNDPSRLYCNTKCKRRAQYKRWYAKRGRATYQRKRQSRV